MSKLHDHLDHKLRYLVAGACLVVIAAGVRTAQGPLTSLLFALLITIAILPVFGGLRRRGMSTGFALTLAALLMIGTILAILAFLGLAATNLVRMVPTYEDKVQGLWLSLAAELEARGIDPHRVAAAELVQPGKVLGFVAGVLSSVGGALSSALFLLIIVAFILAEMAARKMDLEPGGLVAHISQDIRQYLSITAATGAGFAVGVYVLLVAVGTDLAFVWAVVAFVMNFVPNVGIILTFIPPTLLTLLEYGWQRALVVLAGIVVMNFAVDNLIKPRFMSSGLDVTPLVGLVSLIIWGFLLGPPGALLAIPLTLALKRALKADVPPSAATPGEDAGAAAT
ncbi:MAG TPA: AI-2E family transporter [Gemmatimonadales bacterium]